MILRKRKICGVLCGVIFCTLCSGSVYGQTVQDSSKISIRMDLPYDFHAAEPVGTQTVTVNGAPRQLNGAPFVLDGVTYMPIRDLADLLQVEVQYNNLDHTVFLHGMNKDIWIMAAVDRFGDQALIKSRGQDSIVENVGYIMREDRSYAPLRFVAETLGCKVLYDSEHKEIVMEGTGNEEKGYPGKIGESPFSDEQKQVIEAIGKYETAPQVQLKGTRFDTKTEMIFQRSWGENNINRLKIITEEFADEILNGIRTTKITMLDELGRNKNSSEGLAVYHLNPDGTWEFSTPYQYGGHHPFFNLGELQVCGLNKYRNMEVKRVETANQDTVKYQIHFSKKTRQDTIKTVEMTLTIDQATGRLIHYSDPYADISAVFAIPEDFSITY